jgi:disulfide bond formation protein DsbB
MLYAVTKEAMQLFFSMLTVLAAVGAVVLVVSGLLARRGSAGGQAVVDVAGPLRLWLAWVVAATCMLGSLYFSEVANYLPCTLCWYQRIAMYPLAVILLVAAVRRDEGVRWYALPLAAIGAVIALYHYLLERFPDLDAGVCNATIPCEFVWFERFGFITIPFMALVGFVFVIAALTLPDESELEDEGEADTPTPQEVRA